MSTHRLRTIRAAALTTCIVASLLAQGAIAQATQDEAIGDAIQIDNIAENAQNLNPTDRMAVAEAPVQLAEAIVAPQDETTIYDQVNTARVQNCLPILHRNAAIDTVALNWSQTMASSGRFDHNPNYSTAIPNGWTSAGENIASGQPNGQAMFNDWMNSPGHRANILSADFTDIGIGFVRTGTSPGSSTFGTQDFGTYQDHANGPFLDVRDWSKFGTEISWMKTRGLSTGVKIPNCSSEKAYLPKDNVSREAMAAFLYRLEKANYSGPAVSPFADVQPGDKFYNEITWMYAKGYSTGTRQPSGKPVYAPKSQVSREAMAAFIYRMKRASYSGPAASPFADLRKGDKFYNEITWMYKAKLTTGNRQPSGKPTYAPKGKVSREAMAAFVYRLAK